MGWGGDGGGGGNGGGDTGGGERRGALCMLLTAVNVALRIACGAKLACGPKLAPPYNVRSYLYHAHITMYVVSQRLRRVRTQVEMECRHVTRDQQGKRRQQAQTQRPMPQAPVRQAREVVRRVCSRQHLRRRTHQRTRWQAHACPTSPAAGLQSCGGPTNCIPDEAANDERKLPVACIRARTEE